MVLFFMLIGSSLNHCGAFNMMTGSPTYGTINISVALPTNHYCALKCWWVKLQLTILQNTCWLVHLQINIMLYTEGL